MTISPRLADRRFVYSQQEVLPCQFKSHYRRTRREVYPLLSRIQNIGYEQGENGRTLIGIVRITGRLGWPALRRRPPFL